MKRIFTNIKKSRTEFEDFSAFLSGFQYLKTKAVNILPVISWKNKQFSVGY